MRVFPLLWWMASFINAYECVTYGEVNELKERLFRDYVKNTTPVINQSRPVYVFVDLGVKNIITFDEKAGILRATPVFGLLWVDEILKWNATDVGIEFLSLPVDALWQPKIFLQNSVTEEWIINAGAKRNTDAFVYANGTVLNAVAGLTETKCDADIFYYPFDRHSCSWDLLSGLNTQSTVMQSVNYEYTLQADTNKEWISENLKRINTVVTSSFNLSRVVFIFTFKRRPSFLILNILTPIIGLGLLNPVVFALPESSGERVSLSVTILLTLVFYLNMIADRLPPINDPISMLNISVMIQAGNSVIILICTIVSMVIYDKHANNAPVPSFLQKISLFKCLDKKTFKKNKNRINTNAPSSNVEMNKGEETDAYSIETEKAVNESQDSITFEDMGRQANRILLRVFSFLIVMNWVIYLLVILLGSDYHK